MLTLVAGASKSGKTTLPLLFNSKRGWNYAIYSGKKNMKLNVAYSHELKLSKTVRKGLDIEGKFDEEKYESIKDKEIMIPYTYRDLLESYVLTSRGRNPYFFIDQCYRKNISGNENLNIMITDFRFPEEYQFLKKKNLSPITIRIFRDVKEIKSKKYPKYESEHGLDDFSTDFLFLPVDTCEKDFELAIKKYPQYSNYKRNLDTHFDY